MNVEIYLVWWLEWFRVGPIGDVASATFFSRRGVAPKSVFQFGKVIIVRR